MNVVLFAALAFQLQQRRFAHLGIVASIAISATWGWFYDQIGWTELAPE